MPNSFLITGGAGFIGSHLTANLLKSGHRVRILDNFSMSSRDKFAEFLLSVEGDVEIVDGDLRDLAACRAAVEGAEYILHHAALASVPGSIDRPDEYVDVNLTGTTNLLMAAASAQECRRFVFASSSAVYGNLPGNRKHEDDHKDPLSPYATTKLSGEYLCRNFRENRGLQTVALRYFNVFGPRQNPNGPYAAVIPKFIDAIFEGKSPLIYGDGSQSRDFIAVEDVALANLKACFCPAEDVSGKAFNIGSGRATTLNDLVNVLATIAGRTIAPIYLPERSGDIKHSLADITRAEEHLAFSPLISLEDGLRSLFL